MNSLQQFAETASALVIPGNLSHFFSNDYLDSEIASLFGAGRDPQESIDGLMWQFEKKQEEMKRAQERFEAACHARELGERDDENIMWGDGESQDPSLRQTRSRGLLRAEASLAQLELNTVRNQVEYLADLIGRVRRRVELLRRSVGAEFPTAPDA